jgi:hypothetical protein
VWCLRSKHQIERAARATGAWTVSALLRHTKGLGSSLHLSDAGVGTALDPLLTELAEEALDQIDQDAEVGVK